MNNTHGGDIYSARNILYSDKLYDFSANINPLGMPDELKAAVIEAIPSSSAYPDPANRALRRAMADKRGILETQSVFGNGAADIIYRIVLALRPASALLPAPTFSEYEDALKLLGCRCAHFPLREDNGFALDREFLAAMEENQPDIIFLCNPNNPTGALCSRRLLKEVIHKAAEIGCVVVIDECFMDFVEGGEEYTLSGELTKYDNLIILGAFTKMYAMAGVRLGYMLCGNEAMVELVQHTGQPWSVNAFATACGQAAMSLSGFEARSRAYIASERGRLVSALSECGFTVFPPSANYIFFSSPLCDFAARLEEYGILVRSCANYIGLDSHYFRIAVRTAAENERFIAVLRKNFGGRE